MYFYYKKTKSGQTLQLLESYRNSEGKSTHRVIVSLGDAPILKDDWQIIADTVESKLLGQTLLGFRHTPEVNQWVDIIVKRIEREGKWKPIEDIKTKQILSSNKDENQEEVVLDGVILDKIEHTHTTSLGPELLGLKAWESFGMDNKLQELGLNPLQRKTAAASVISRLTNPGSENELLKFIDQSSFPDLFGEEILKGKKDRFYRVSDKLMGNKDKIEKHLREAAQEHFGLERTILLYDLTNTHFEGKGEENPKAKHGHNKQKRDDCPQIVVGMIFDENGFELAHETFEGNKSDQKSLLQMIEHMEKLTKKDGELELAPKSMVIVDGGISSKANLSLLREKGFAYLVNDSRRCRIKYENEFEEKEGFQTVTGREKKTPVQVRVIVEERIEEFNGQQKVIREQVVLCRSDARKEKEQAIISGAEKRLLDDLKNLQIQIDNGQLKDSNKIERKIGKIMNKHSRASRFYKVELNNVGAKRILFYERINDKYEKNQELLGCYVLRTSELNLKADELWKLYITLARAEEGFRYLKSDLGLRPNYHQTQYRVDGHVFITVLAYHLLKFITHTLEKAGDYRAFSTICRILQTHCYATVMLETREGTIHRIRKPGLPEECQKEIYQHFDIDLKRLPRTKSITHSKK